MKRKRILKLIIALEILAALFLCNSLIAQEGPAKNAATEKQKKEAALLEKKKEKFKKATEAKIKQGLELKTRRQRAAGRELKRQQELQDKAGQRESEIKAKQEESERKKQEQKRLVAAREMVRQQELTARQEELEQKEQERQDRILELQIERHQKLRAGQEELARAKEEKEKKLAELKAKRNEETRRRDLQLQQKKDEEQRRIAEAEERQRKELAREKEGSIRQLREIKDKLEEEVIAKKKELAGKKQEKFKRITELKLKEKLEVKAGQEETDREKLEQDLQARAKQEEAARQKIERDLQLKARQEEAARLEEEKGKKLAQKKAEQERKLKARQEQAAREEKPGQMGLFSKIKEWQQKKPARQEEPYRRKELPWQAGEREGLSRPEEGAGKKQAEALKKEQKLTQQEIEKQKQALEYEARLQQGLKATQQELLRQKEELNKKIMEMKKSTLQEKAVTEVMLKKHKEDEAKIIKIDKLWMRARKLYSQGMYEEAINDFEEIIKLEGNPRIKYTPQAKEFIEKAKERIEEIKKDNLSREVGDVENDMMHEVLKRQIPPYVEPPAKPEKLEESPLIEPPAIRKKLKEKKITMDFDKVDLKSVLLFLSQESGINFVASNKVMELGLKVTTRFNDTPLDEVIKYIIKSLGIIYRIDKEVVWIAHPDEVAQEALETRVYYLTKGGGLFSEFSSISGGTDTSLGGSSSQITKIATIEDTLKEVVPWPQDAKMTFDKRINALIVRNTPQNLQTLEDMLFGLDITPLQILIEARFLEVNVTDTEELGLEWKIANTNFPVKKMTEAGGSKGFGHGIAKDSGVDFSAFTRAAEGFNLTYKGLLTTPQFEAVLHALEESKKTKTLSSPRITTLNNQMATIKVVDEWLYPTRYEYEVVQTDVNGDGDFDDSNETTYKNVPKDFLRRDVGILLKVIPSAGADKKTISLSLIPEVSEATADFFTYTGDVKLPRFTSRNLSTTVVVNSGETVVLGGLIKESRTKTLTKVPFLGDIPFIGAAFKKNTDSIERKNLLIFVTARILSPSGEEVVVAQK